MAIQLPKLEQSSKGLLKESFANLPGEDNKEAVPFHISYFYYNDKLCELNELRKNMPKKVLNDLRKIGRLCNVSDFKANGIDHDPIVNAGNYKPLFHNLPTDADLRESRIQSDGRMFYFVINKTVYLVLLKNTHFEVKKQRK